MADPGLVSPPEMESEQRPPAASSPATRWGDRVKAGLQEYFGVADPDVILALMPFAFLSMTLFTRHPYKTNFIFDEQEALLANPFVRSVSDPQSKLHWGDAFYRDFWGLTPEGTIGSYRPLPDLVWRLLWWLGARDSPFFHHWINVLLHALNGALLTVLVVRLTKDRLAAWLAGAFFVGAAILTEAVSGVVGIADVMGGTGAMLALLSLTLPMGTMMPALFAATLFGLYSKESALCVVPLVPFAALLWSDTLHPARPRRGLRCLAASAATLVAFVLYVELRRRMFPARIAPEYAATANAGKDWAHRTFAALLRWYAQPILPHDPLNNPLVEATTKERISAAFRVYVRGLGQVVFPRSLSGDYSAPQEPIPEDLFSVESVLGAILFALPLVVGFGLAAYWLVRRWLAPGRFESGGEVDARADTIAAPALAFEGKPSLVPVVAVALVWVVVSYFPVSNIPIVLPTVRAERFWYFPVIGTSVLLALAAARLYAKERATGSVTLIVSGIVAFVVMQGIFARRHANDYTDDLVFWGATRKAVPRSAKSHLNYSVMLGARGRLHERLGANAIALELSPRWPMAHIYYGDTLCRLHRPEEAWPHYKSGFALANGDPNLIALGLQCLWDEKMITPDGPHRDELEDVAKPYPGSWLDYLVRDILEKGEENKGVDPKYRPRGYNEGPKKD